MFVYRCVAERLNHPEMGNYDTFGIVADEVIEGKTMGRVLAAVEDVRQTVRLWSSWRGNAPSCSWNRASCRM